MVDGRARPRLMTLAGHAVAVSTASARSAAAGVEGEALCVVTGGSSGIGAAICAHFQRRGGYRVLSLARRGGPDVAEVEGVEADLASSSGVDKACEAVRKRLSGRARICLVHCASNYPSDSAQEVDLPGLDGALRLNVTAPAELTSRLLPVMAEGSSVVFVGSTLSEKAVAGRLSYCTAKHAMVGLMRAVAQDILWSGVHTVLVCPGITDTPMVRQAVAEREEAFRSFVRELQGRQLDPDEVASVVWDVAQSPILHGSVIHCNGGQRER